MNFKTVVLVVLVLALAGLGALFYQNQRLLEESLRAREEAQAQEAISQREKELAELKAGLNETRSMRDSQVSSAQTAAAPSDTEKRIKELEAQLARQREQTDAARQEAELLARNEADKRDEGSKMAGQVENARVVGKVISYDKESNLLIFQPVGQPSLMNNQELAIRRRNGVFAYLTVDELDQESGTYTATIKMDELFKIGVEVEPPISEGEDIIIPPPILQPELPSLDDGSSKKDGGAANPANLAPIPWAE